ncbi:MAG: hypothetical protein BHW36_12145, partial [Firmicutes bacterium CAG:24053_14]
MARRGENIYKRGDGRWEGRYIRGRTPEGRAQYGYVYAATYSACREKRRQCLRELPREITPSNNMTLPEAVDLFFAERGRKLKESTASRYRYVVRQYIQPQLGAAPLYALTEQRVADFYRKLQEQGLSAKSTRDVGVLLRAILRTAAKRGCFCTGLNAELPAYKKRQVEIFTEPEIVQLAHHIMDEPDLTGLGVLLTLNSGLRLGELCALRWSDIDLHAGFLRVEREVQRLYEKGHTRLVVQPPKSESSCRRIPLPADMLSLLARYKPKHVGSFCLLTSSGDPLEPRTMQNRYRSLLKRAGVPYRNFHGRASRTAIFMPCGTPTPHAASSRMWMSKASARCWATVTCGSRCKPMSMCPYVTSSRRCRASVFSPFAVGTLRRQKSRQVKRKP